MADDDEIDILGDFSFNSCLAQNNQGIPSCSDREDTVHPQWLLDSPPANWYDIKINNRSKEGPSRKLSGNNSNQNQNEVFHIAWTQEERDILKLEMEKYGRNVKKISQTLTTKSEAEIQALIEAEHGIHLDTLVWEKHDDQDNIPHVAQEEIIADEIISMSDVISMVTTGSPTITLPKKVFRKNSKVPQSINSVSGINMNKIGVNNLSSKDSKEELSEMTKNFVKQKEKMKAVKKLGNHRRKVSRNYDKGRVKSKDMKSPQGRKTDSSLSEDSVKSPKMQIVLGSGQALPVSEGEQVIKIEKKKDSDEDSDIEIDVDSETEGDTPKKKDNLAEDNKSPVKENSDSAPIAVPLRRLEMPRRRRKINLDGGGGYRILHTEAGDVYEVSSEPRKERQARKQPVQLIRCKEYGPDRPAPCEVHLHVSVLISMDVHAHTSRAEVMGLVGGRQVTGGVLLSAYRPARAAANSVHCDMDPVSQASAGDYLTSLGLSVCGWHHSHPHFPAAPSPRDLATQRELQAALEWRLPFLALLTSQRPPAPHYSCFRVEETDEPTPTGYQVDLQLIPNITAQNVTQYIRGLQELLQLVERTAHSVDMKRDVCPHTGVCYLDKCIWSVSRNMRQAGYETDDPVVKQLIQGVRDIFR
ncbi:unnamed protein product [Colias eurytheme]|nr:unnamed protein product [Colias eurytheme]